MQRKLFDLTWLSVECSYSNIFEFIAPRETDVCMFQSTYNYFVLQYFFKIFQRCRMILNLAWESKRLFEKFL